LLENRQNFSNSKAGYEGALRVLFTRGVSSCPVLLWAFGDASSRQDLKARHSSLLAESLPNIREQSEENHDGE